MPRGKRGGRTGRIRKIICGLTKLKCNYCRGTDCPDIIRK